MTEIAIRDVRGADLDALEKLENASFETDRLSRRRLRHWIRADNRVFQVAESDGQLLGYGLVLFHGTTRLARLYSIAIDASARGRGVAQRLLAALESAAAARGRFFMRLEVAQDNAAALRLYETAGYGPFDTVEDYYEDHGTAVRMQKVIRQLPVPSESDTKSLPTPVPWYQQSTEFTCGPAALMMAMTALDSDIRPSRTLELDIWREATTIFMTSGHGGCHPLGLALAAARRGFSTNTFINRKTPLFLEGVRQESKKHVLELVHHQFVADARQQKLRVQYRDIAQKDIESCLKRGGLAVVLVSSYQLDRKKAPHWVTITAVDDDCFYVNDPDPSVEEQTGLDCENLPIAREDFARMSQFGKDRLRTAVLIKKLN